jgi:hypothetical protein
VRRVFLLGLQKKQPVSSYGTGNILLYVWLGDNGSLLAEPVFVAAVAAALLPCWLND